MTLESVDYAILAILAISAAISLTRGFVKEALSMALWVVAFIVTMSFNERVAVYLIDTVDLPSMRLAIASVGLFVLTLIAGSILNYVVGALIKISGLGGLDRLLGLIFGTVRGGLIVLALVILVPTLIPVEQDPWWTSSVLIPYFVEFEAWGVETWVWLREILMGWI